MHHAIDGDTSNLAAKRLRDINKLVNVPTSFNNLKTKVDDLDVVKLKTIDLDLGKLNDAVDEQVAKDKKINTLKAKVIFLEKKCWCNYFH